MTVAIADLRLALSEFELRVDGELASGWTGLVGPSGAGKTSLLEIVAGFRAPDAGRIAIDGVVVADPARGTFAPPRARRIGYVTQDDTLFPHRSVRGNLAFAAHGRATDAAGLGLVVSRLGLASLLERSVRTLSGGEKRRVALGRALLARPRLLLLDEPLTGLDPASRASMIAALRAVHDEFRTPTIYVAHNPEEIVALCDDVLVLVRGRVERRGKPREILEAPLPADG
jgi:molybdate transport system ATP-binding protein